MPLAVKNKTTQTENVAEKNSAAIQAEMPVAQASENLGKLSDKLKFVAPLVDPSQDDITYLEVDGKKEKKVDKIIVGYRFVSDIDLEVPDVKPGDDFKKNLMSFTGDPTATRTVKANEPFDLTKFETGLLISREEFNGKATGGQLQVTCSYAMNTKKTSNGTPAVDSAISKATVPSIALRAINGSIRSAKPVDVLTYTVSEDAVTKAKRKHRTIIKGFEKFEPLCKEIVSTSVRVGGTKPATEQRNQNAAAFLKIAMSKKA